MKTQKLYLFTKKQHKSSEKHKQGNNLQNKTIDVTQQNPINKFVVIIIKLCRKLSAEK